MKYKSFVFVLLIIPIIINAQVGNWRPLEKEVKVYLKTATDYQLIQDYKFNGDCFSGFAILYLIPEELNIIKKNQLDYTVICEDLNANSQGFWTRSVQFHSYEGIITLMDSLVEAYPDICSKIIYGESMEGRELVALKISDNVEIDEPEAEILFDGGIHGDEICGAENLIRLARHLCTEYDEDDYITDLIDEREIYLYCMVNPDGRHHLIRRNMNGVDLNRDCGYMWDAWGGSTDAYSQIESKALRNCMYQNQFPIHITYHGGTEYMSLPWSYRPERPTDWDEIYFTAENYQQESGYNVLEFGQGNSGMYPINGSTKDANYGINGSVTFTMEISEEKQPPPHHLMIYYNFNLPSMIKMIELAGYGLQGTITNSISGEPIAAVIMVDDKLPVYSDPLVGDFHKLLMDGDYTLTIHANGYESKTINNVEAYDDWVNTIDIQMEPKAGHYVYKIPSCRIPDNNGSDEGNTRAVLGEPDDINYSIGKSGWIILDMQYPFADGIGDDIIVYEGDESPEDFGCFVSISMDGPWVPLGAGTGTTSFDLANIESGDYQYIKIIDDGDGSSIVDNAGFDLDAISISDQYVGIKNNIENSSLRIYPNPFTDQLNMEIVKNKACELIFKLTDITGKQILSEEVFCKSGYNTINFDFSSIELELTTGIYIIQVNDGSKVYSKKIIKK